MDLVVSVYQLTKFFPEDERFGLRAQARRAAISIPSNIAEGQGRWHPREFLQGLSVARSSLQELETQIEAMVRLGYKEREDVKDAEHDADEVASMLVGLMKAVRKRL
jgi:four helix bundle protein